MRVIKRKPSSWPKEFAQSDWEGARLMDADLEKKK